MDGPDPRRHARRDVVGAIIGGEAGAGIGLLAVGSTPLAPLGFVVLGAAAGFCVMHARHALMRRWLRSHLRAAR